MELIIYSQNGDVKMTASPSTSSAWSRELMVENAVSVSFTHPAYVQLDVNDYVLLGGIKFAIQKLYKPKQNNEQEYTYSVRFYGPEHDAQRVKYLNLTDGQYNPQFSLDGSPREHLKKVVDNLNRIYGEVKWSIGETVQAPNQNIEYNNLWCWDALAAMAEAFKTEWWADGYELNLSRCERGERISLGYQQGLTQLLQSENSNTVEFFTRLIPLGTTKNIDPTRYGYTRLQLPDRKKYVDLNTDLYGIYDHVEENAFSQIYPHYTGKITEVRTVVRTGQNGKPFTVYYFKDSGMSFNPSSKECEMGLVKHVSFQSGDLNGRDFEANYDSTNKEWEIVNTYPSDTVQIPGGNLIPRVGDAYIPWNFRMPVEYEKQAEQDFQAAVNDFLSKYSFDTSKYGGDTDYIYVTENDTPLILGQSVRLLSSQYFGTAGYLDTRMTKVVRKLDNLNIATIECTNKVGQGWKTNVDSSLSQLQYIVAQQQAEISQDILKSWDEREPTDYRLMTALRVLKEISERSLSRKAPDQAAEIIDFLKGLTVNGDKASIDKDGNATVQQLIALVKAQVAALEVTGNTKTDSLDVTETAKAKDVEVSNSVTTLNAVIQALAKTHDLTVENTADIMNGIIRKYLTSDSFVSGFLGSGFKIWKDENGLWHGELDELTVRKTFLVFELVVQKIVHQGGMVIRSAAGGKLKKVTDGGTYWKCEHDSTDDFVVGDQVLCQTFTGTSMKRYWRLVTSAGAGYFNLSKSDCETGSANPEAGDEVAVLGNRTVTARQKAQIDCAVGDDAPYRDDYSGISSYSLVGKLINRTGNLSGITDPDFGALSGSGLYGINVYLKGIFRLLSGKTVETAISDAQAESNAYTDGKITKIETSFEIREGQISSKVTEATAAATNAGNSATLAQGYASTATSKASAASNSASSAAGSATTAGQKASAAAGSAADAKSAADNASDILSQVTTKESSINQTAGNITLQVQEVTTKVTTATNAANTATTKASEASTSAGTASTKASAAATSATNAKTSETNASGSASTASSKASAADNSAKAAADSATAAATSAASAADVLTEVIEKKSSIEQTASNITLQVTEVTTKTTQAATSATNAASSAGSAASSATTASTKASEASTSAGTASTKASAAATSATNAKTSETNASGSASTASSKASAADNSAKAAADSATAAATSAASAADVLTEVIEKKSSIEQTASNITLQVTEVTTKTTQAATSATNAASSAGSAASSATTASTKASEASTSAGTASTKASAAATSADTASTKASAASGSASAAATSATNASNSASSAASSASAATNVLTTVTQKETSINQTADAIELKAVRAESAAGRAESAEASINLKADGIVLQASNQAAKSAVDGVQIGGRNYFINSQRHISYGSGLVYDAYNSECPYGFYAVGNKAQDSTNWLRIAQVIKLNGYWTVSWEMRGSQNTPVGVYVDICDIGRTYFNTTGNNTWKRFSLTVNVTNYGDGGTYNFVDFEIFRWAFFYIRNIKVELGTKATDWAPAPEDVDADATNKANTAQNNAISAAATDATSKANTAESNAKGYANNTFTTKTEFSSQLTILNNSISTKVSQTDFNSLGSRVGNAETTISQHTNLIALKASQSDLTALGSRVTSAEAKITSDAINLTVKSQTQTIAQQAADNIQVGGRNLASNTGFINNSMQYWNFYSPTGAATKSIVVESSAIGGLAIQYTFTSAGICGPYYSAPSYVPGHLKIKSQYTVSCWIKSSVAGSFDFGLEGGNTYIKNIVANTWTYFSKVFTFTGTTNSAIHMYHNVSVPIGGIISVHSLKIEAGNKATDWTPAPEDVDASIALRPTTDEIKSQFTMDQTGISMLGKKISLTGLITFSSLDSSTQSTINSKATTGYVDGAKSSAISTAATDATTKANTAESNAKGYSDILKNSLGSLAYANTVSLAKLDTTIIEGGYIKTSLINANAIITNELLATKIAATDITTRRLKVGEGCTVGDFSIGSGRIGISTSPDGIGDSGMFLYADMIGFNSTITLSGGQRSSRQAIVGTYSVLGYPRLGQFIDTTSDYMPNVGLVFDINSTNNGGRNYAFVGRGNGVLNGFMCGYAFQELSFTKANQWQEISKLTSVVGIYGNYNNWAVVLPTFASVCNALNIGYNTPFVFQITVLCTSAVDSGKLYGRSNSGISGISGYEYPELHDWNNGIDNGGYVMGAGDSFQIVLFGQNNGTSSIPVASGSYRAYIVNKLS